MTKSRMLEELNGENRRTLELVQVFGKNDFDQPGAAGAWTAKDVFGHLSYWNEQAKKSIELALRGERPSPWLDGDVEAINAREVTVRRERPLHKIMEEYRRSHKELAAVLERAPDNQFERESEHKTREGKSANAAWISQAVLKHYRNHREAIEAWLAKN